MFKLFSSFLISIIFMASVPANASAPLSESEALKTLEQLKIDVIALTRDVTLLKEQMTYPDQQKLSVYFSLTDTPNFTLKDVRLIIDEQQVKQTDFPGRELTLLEQGGAQRLFVGNIATGEHVITAFFTGLLNGQNYKRGITASFTTTKEPFALALIIEPAPDNRPVHFKLVEL